MYKHFPGIRLNIMLFYQQLLFLPKNIKIAGNEYYQDDKRSDVAQIELNYLVLRELDSVAGISFGNKAVPAPALLNSTEEEEEH